MCTCLAGDLVTDLVPLLLDITQELLVLEISIVNLLPDQRSEQLEEFLLHLVIVLLLDELDDLLLDLVSILFVLLYQF